MYGMFRLADPVLQREPPPMLSGHIGSELYALGMHACTPNRRSYHGNEGRARIKRGRPKWAKLKPYTIAMRKWRATSPNAPSPRSAFSTKILEVTGTLRGSFTFTARPKRLDVGTAQKGADVHQFGKWVAAPKRWERTMVKVEKRQLIGIHPEDEKKAIEFAVWHLKKLVPGAR